MTRRRAGFTLVEAILALAITGVVAALSYAALSAGLDTDQRVRAMGTVADDDTRWRALAGDALRHVLDAAQPGQPALRTGPNLAAFRTSALGTPSGAGAAWSVRLSVQDSAAVLTAINEETNAELVARIPGISALRVRAQSLGSSGDWQEDWTSASPPPAVRIDFVSRSGTVQPLVVSVGLRP